MLGKTPEDGERVMQSLCQSSPSFPHRRAPEWLHGLTAFHLTALFPGCLEYASVLLEKNADKNALGLHGETALGFVVERGVEAEVRQWTELLGSGAPIPPDLLIKSVTTYMKSDGTIVELLFDNGIVAHTDIERLTPDGSNLTLAYLPAHMPRVILSETPPHGLYGPDHLGHDCSLHLPKCEFEELMQQNPSISDSLHFNHAVKTRCTIKGAITNMP